MADHWIERFLGCAVWHAQQRTMPTISDLVKYLDLHSYHCDNTTLCVFDKYMLYKYEDVSLAAEIVCY